MGSGPLEGSGFSESGAVKGHLSRTPELLLMNRQRRSHTDLQSQVGSGLGQQRRAGPIYDHEDSDVTERLIDSTGQDPAALDMQRPHSFPLGTYALTSALRNAG